MFDSVLCKLLIPVIPSRFDVMHVGVTEHLNNLLMTFVDPYGFVIAYSDVQLEETAKYEFGFSFGFFKSLVRVHEIV